MSKPRTTLSTVNKLLSVLLQKLTIETGASLHNVQKIYFKILPELRITVLPTKSDSDVVFCLCINHIRRIGLIHK